MCENLIRNMRQRYNAQTKSLYPLRDQTPFPRYPYKPPSVPKTPGTRLLSLMPYQYTSSMSLAKLKSLSFFLIIASDIPSRPILAYWNLDALCSEAFAQSCTLDDTGELLRAIDLEGFGEAGSEDRGRSIAWGGGTGRRSDVDKVHLESRKRGISEYSVNVDRRRTKDSLPEDTLRPDTKILQDEPYAHIVFRIGKLERTNTKTPNQIPSEHALRCRRGSVRIYCVVRRQQSTLWLLHVRSVVA